MTKVGIGGSAYGPKTVAYAPPLAVTTISFMPPSNFLPLLSASHRRSCLPVMSSSRMAPGSFVHARRKVFLFVSANPLWPQPGVLFNTVAFLPSHFDSVLEIQPT